MSANGENQRPLFPDPKADVEVAVMRFFPRWSADGKRIVFGDCTDDGDAQSCRLSIARIGDKRIQDIHNRLDRLGEKLLLGTSCWMENNRAILIDLMKDWDKPNANYDLYRYDLQTRGLKRLTSEPSDEEYPDWSEGALSVSPKLTTLWGEVKKDSE